MAWATEKMVESWTVAGIGLRVKIGTNLRNLWEIEKGSAD